jgi:hypothetical protein
MARVGLWMLYGLTVDVCDRSLYRVIQFNDSVLLIYDFGSAFFFHRIQHVILRLTRESYDSNLRIPGLNQSGRCDSVHLGHDNVHHDDCRQNLCDALKSLLTITRFTNHFEIGIAFQVTAQPLPYHGVVIYQ